MKKWLPFPLMAALLALSLSSCIEPDDEGTPTDSPENLGWSGDDDMNTVQTNVTFFGGNGNLPSQVDLVPKFPPIGNQGQYGTCVAWATAYNYKTAINGMEKGYTASQLGSPAYQFSPKDLYLAIPDNFKAANPCKGTDFAAALNVLRDRGVATMQTVPYDGLGDCSQSNSQSSWANEAGSHRVEYWRKIEASGPDALKALLADNIPLIFGARLSDNFMTWNSQAVLSSNSTFYNVGQHAYHALVLAGYDDSKNAFKVINSWGTTWGAQGYIWVDYDFFMSEFCQNAAGDKPIFMAVNKGGSITPPDDVDPVSSGVDLAAWVFEDYPDGYYQGYPKRVSNFNVYNVGNQTAKASKQWTMYYLAFNAYDANDYGVLFSCTLDPSVSYGTENCADFNTCTYNVDIPSGSDFASEMQFSDFNFAYVMPDITGYYYLAIYIDPFDVFSETDETNNIFYPYSDPIYFTNGAVVMGGPDTRSAESAKDGFRFKNTLPPTSLNLRRNAYNGAAMLKRQPNAYRQTELAAVLRASKLDGRLTKKVLEMKARNPQR